MHIVTKKIEEHKYLLFIVLLASLLRFVLPNTPPSLNWDEISHGYNAYSILTTGRDEWGKLFPTIFRAYGDYKLPVYIYVTAISEFFFGMTTFAVRLPSILAGIGTVIFTYFLVLELIKHFPYDSGIKHNVYAAIAALLVAIEPWSFFLSRAAFEANLALFLFVAGIYFFIKSINSKLSYPLPFLSSILFFGLTVWTYNSYRIFTPLMLGAVILINRHELLEAYLLRKRLIVFSTLLLSFFLIPMFYQLMNPIGQARYSWVGILDQGSINKINESRGMGCSRVICNKYIYIAKEFSQNYISHFSISYLFNEGGSQYQFSVPNMGMLYLIDLPIILLGLVLLLNHKFLNRKSKLLIISWLLLAPIPSALTREAPHVLRSITLLPIPMILSAFGVYSLSKWFKTLPLIFFVILLFFSTESYLIPYFKDYRIKYSESWQYGYGDVSRFIKENYNNYDKIIITKKYGEPHEFLLFNLGWDSNKYNNDPNLNRFGQSNWFWVDGFDKFYFVNDWEIPMEGNVYVQESKKVVNCNASKCLLVTSPNNAPVSWSKVETVNFLDGKPAFELYTN